MILVPIRSTSRLADDRLARCSMRSRFISRVNSWQNSSKSSWLRSFSWSAFSTRASTSSRRMVRWLSHRPWSRAPKHPRRCLPVMMNPAPQMPHFVRPENRYCGRRAPAGLPAVLTACRLCFWRGFAAVQSSSQHDSQSGTSFRIHSVAGFRRDTRFPVSGFFT